MGWATNCNFRYKFQKRRENDENRNRTVIRISKAELPPATGFWSLTLCDLKNGFFIPNDRKKYSVGENAGFKLNTNGGMETYISAAKPSGVPEENRLPINRGDEGIDAMFRVYAPDVEKMKTWKTPQAEMLAGEATPRVEGDEGA